MLAILRVNLIYYMKNIEEVIYISSLFLIINFMFYFSLNNTVQGVDLFKITQWVSLFVASILLCSNLYQRDHDSGILEVYRQLLLPNYMVVLSKLLASWLVLMIGITVALPLTFLLARQSFEFFGMDILELGVGGFGIIALSNLAAALTVGLQRGRAILLLLVFPLIIPILIFTLSATDGQTHWGLLLAYDCFLLPIVCVCGSAAIENAS